MARLALGLDSSTQSLSSIIVDIDTAEKLFEHSIADVGWALPTSLLRTQECEFYQQGSEEWRD